MSLSSIRRLAAVALPRLRQVRLFLLSMVLVAGAAPAWAVDVLVSNLTDVPDPAPRGGTIVYTATISNDDADVASNVVLAFALDPQTDFERFDDARCRYLSAGHKVECSYPVLKGNTEGEGSADVVVVKVTVRSKVTAGDTVEVTASVTSPDDTTSANNALTRGTTIDNGADLALALSDSPDPVLAGANLTYAVNVTNRGPDAAGATEVLLTLSPDLTYASASGSGWTCTGAGAGARVTCRRASAALGNQPELKITSKVTGAVNGTITSAATVSTTGSAIDYEPGNDDASVSTTVNAGADLTVTKTASATRAESGAAVAFTLRPRNAGPFAAANVTLTDTVPTGFAIVSAAGAGWNCPVAGQVVTCTRARMDAGATDTIVVNTTAPSVIANTRYTNTAHIASDTPDPDRSNDSGSVGLDVLPPGVDLSISKTKTPNPVAEGGTLRSTIAVTNHGPQRARAGEVLVTEDFNANETFDSIDPASGAGWSCAAPAGSRVTCTYAAALDVGDKTPDLVLRTLATAAGAATNDACAVYRDSVGSMIDPVPGNNCQGRTVSVTAAPAAVDLRIAKTADADPLVWNADTLRYRIVVSNVAAAGATGVEMSDDIPGYMTGTGIQARQVGGTSMAQFGCKVTGRNVTCTQKDGTLGKDQTAEFLIEVTRPLLDSGAGKHTNTATVRSTDQGDLVPADNTASVDVKVEPVADIQVDSKVTPASTEAGTNATFVLTVKNNGPSTANGVTLRQAFALSDGTMTYVSASPSRGNCTWAPASATLDCAIGTLTSGTSQTVTVVVRPDYMRTPPPGRTLTGSASVATTTNESQSANNSAASSLQVTQAALDLLVDTTDSPDPLGFVPASGNPGPQDNIVTYRNEITNRGPSVASDLVLAYRMQAPAGKAITFLGDKATAGGAYVNYCDKKGQQATSSAPLELTCRFPGSFILNASNAKTELYLDFRVDTPPSAGGDTFRSVATISSNEPDSVSANDRVEQTTTIRMRSDLQMTKSARAWNGSADVAVTAVQLRQPFYWVLSLRNAGPGDSQITNITDTLPPGVTLYRPGASAPAPYNGQPYAGGVRWSTDNASPTGGTCSTASRIECSIGVLESGKTATVWIPVTVARTGGFQNCASATASEVDPVSGNNTGCASVTVQASSLAGSVYIDVNANGQRDAGDSGINGVALSLSGTDAYGNAVSSAGTSNATGAFSFDNLSPGTYALAETQPSAYLDGRDAAGSAGGTPGAIGTDRIEGIALAGNTAATGYLFGEVQRTSLAGYVFVDTNGDARRDAGEGTGIASVTMTLTGTDDAGTVERSTDTGAAGLYTFADLRPGTYVVTQAVIAGVTHTGMSIGSKGGNDGAAVLAPGQVVPGPDKRSIGNIVLAGGDSATGYNFGESGQGLSGFVYADDNGNGRKDAGEPGIAGIAITLSGKTAGGADVCVAISPNPCTVRSSANGAYAFSGVPASDAAGYQIRQQAQDEAPLSNYADGAEQVGTLGGNAGTNDVFSGIVVKVGDFGADYNFGERAGAIAGRVYLDANDNRAPDVGETGIAGVTVTLSGRSASGADVCSVLASCSATTDAEGRYAFASLPAANADGFTLTETQPADWGEGTTAAGSAGGTVAAAAGSSTVSGIALGAGARADGYLFGERGAVLSGSTYLDADNDGVRDPGETGIAGVGFTLRGTTASGVDVCTLVNCSASTGADGGYRFAPLPNADAGGYTIAQQAQTQAPLAELLDGKVSAGAHCGACVVDNGLPNAIGAIRVDASPATGAFSAYDFGELRAATLAGRVYVDANENGAMEAGEALAGVALTLTGNDDRGNAVSRSVASGADGSYRIDGLRPSSPAGYTITETQPAGYLDFPGAGGSAAGTVDGVASGSAQPNAVEGIVLGNAAMATGYDFRETGASLAGSVYVDANDNGARDSSETALPDVVVTLTGDDARGNRVNLVARTGADGGYRFAGLAGGTYTLTETHPAGVLDGRETAGSSGGVVDNTGFDNTEARNRIAGIALAPGAVATGYLFGERLMPRLGNLFGRVYLDSNGNGRADEGEPGIAGVVMVLSGTSPRGAPVKLTVATGASGAFAFNALEPSGAGGYTLSQTQPANYTDGATTVPAGLSGRAGAAKPVAAGQGDTVVGIEIVAGSNLSGYSFGEQPLATTEPTDPAGQGSIAGVVYLDRDDDGVRAEGEPGIGGVALALSGRARDGKDVQRTVLTGADGSFRFGDLPPSDDAGYTLVQTQPADWRDGRTTLAAGLPGVAAGAKPVAQGGADTVRGIVLAEGRQLDGYRFGERARGARIAGSVYVDRNNDGVRDAGEAGIGGVTVTLDGRQADGAPLERSVVTDADGRFAFADLAPSDAAGYRLAELQPAGVADGKTTLAGLPGSAAGAKPVRVGDQDAVRAIVLAQEASLDGYLFGETAIPSLKPPIVNGYVWLDRGHRRVRPVDGTLQGLAGWTVELRRHEQRICGAQTDEDGFYQFDNLHCPGYEVDGLPTGDGFAIVFSREGSNLPAVAQSGGGKGKVSPSGGMITDITLNAGDQVVEQNLPLDPAGVVYDAQTRRPVAGAVVAIAGPGGFVPARHLVGAEAAQRQTVGSDGMYQFLLQGDFPSGVYTLAVQSPSGYLAAPSTLLAPCPGAPAVTLVPTPALVQRSDGAPPVSVPLHRPEACAGIVAGGADSTQYYLAFQITNGGSAPILNNHIPLDRGAQDGLVLTKTTPMVNVARGELVPYTITASNGAAAALADVVVRDLMPPGFKYRPGSARVNGVAVEPQVAGRELSWPARTLAPKERVSTTLVLAVGAGVGEGEYVNQALAVDLAGNPLASPATAAVRIVPDATFDCPDVIGKVFDDANANGYQDEGEPGLAAVRLATPRGLLVTTDAEGRYHVPCAALPNPDRGSNFVMKLDERTLPSGYRVTTANPGDVRVTRGKVSKLNFGAAIHRVVRVELFDAAFEAGGDALRAQWKRQIDTMMEQLRNKPSVLRIAYARGADGEAAAERRVQALRADIAARWKALGDIYPLAIEVEVVR